MKKDRRSGPVGKFTQSTASRYAVGKLLVAFEDGGDTEAVSGFHLFYTQNTGLAAHPCVFCRGIILRHREYDLQLRALRNTVAQIHENATRTDVTRMTFEFLDGFSVLLFHLDGNFGRDSLLPPQLTFRFRRHRFSARTERPVLLPFCCKLHSLCESRG